MIITNKISQKNIKICRTNRTVLQLNLLWPNDGTELNPGFQYKMKVFAFFFITGILTLSVTTHLVLRYKITNLIDSEEISLLIAAYGTYYMVFAFVKNQQQIACLLQDLSNFDKFGKPDNFEIEENRLNFFVKLFVFYSSLAIFISALLNLIWKQECKDFHYNEGSNNNHCGLIAPMWIPFEINYFPMFELCFLFGFISAYVLIKMCFHISFNALEIGRHIIVRINHLRMMIITCFDDETYEESRKKLQNCIFYHLEILNFTQRLDKAFFNPMFGHFALTGIICACVEKQLVDGDNVYSGILHFIGWIFALFVGCIAGQQLLDASDIIPEAIWLSKWYKTDVRLRKDLMFMLMRSQKEFHLRGGPFVILSYPLFVSVLKTSYSILCVLTSNKN